MRGYYAGRYRDKKFLGAQVEYRFPIYWRISGTTFASTGQVADELNDFHFGGFKWAGGVGLRFAVLPSEKLNLRFDVAHGETLNYYCSGRSVLSPDSPDSYRDRECPDRPDSHRD